MVDKVANKALRIQHYENYRSYLENSKVKNNTEMARKVGISPSAFTDWKNGRSEPKMEKMCLIAKALRVSPNKLIGA